MVVASSEGDERGAAVANRSAVDLEQHVARTQAAPSPVRLEHEKAALTATTQVCREILVHTSEPKSLQRERRVVAVVHLDAAARRGQWRGVHGGFGVRHSKG